MKKYEEEKYRFENIKERIYPWIRRELGTPYALNGKHITEKDTPVVSFIGDLRIILVIKGDEDWQVCVDKLKDDLVIMVPTRETVLFAPASQKEAVRKMTEHGRQSYEQDNDKISHGLMLFSKDRKELSVWKEEE